MPTTLASYIAGCWDSGIPTSYIAAAWTTRVAALHPGADRVAVAEVAGDQLAAELGQLARFLRAADEADDLVAALAQLAGHGAADEAGRPCHEDLDRPSL